MRSSTYDVIIVGAGLSGIGAAWHLQQQCPAKSYCILESRDSLGGTWDLFRYPGIRSDSDMHTLGYAFKPWRESKAIADGPAILRYIRETAAESGISRHIRYGQKVLSASWSSADSRWSVVSEGRGGGNRTLLQCSMLLLCAGYYDYERGYTPVFPGQERFKGSIVHPQHWPEDLDYKGKKVIVIGSGATAMTLVPALAGTARQVTLLQRSPTWVISLPSRDPLANFLRRVLPERMAYRFTRWKNVLLQTGGYRLARAMPGLARHLLLRHVRRNLGRDYDIGRHFTPSYQPWDQRLCLLPDRDLFKAINCGKAVVVTGEIETFKETGIVLKSGHELEADIIVTATGLELVVLGKIGFTVDGKSVDFSTTYSYKGMMISDVPNLIATFGYVNASWTLRADLIAEYTCRLIQFMDRKGYRRCTPRLRETERTMPARYWIDIFSSNYFQRAMHAFPRQGDHEPWINPQVYSRDRKMMQRSPIEDGILEFSA